MTRRLSQISSCQIASIALLAIVLAGCGDSGPSSGLRVVKMPIGTRTFELEVADTIASREKGLMQRDSMADDHGMIFVFEKAEKLNFWMKNTRFPLDIIYVDGDGKIVSIKQMKAYDQTGIPSGAPALYAIELNKGAATANGVKAGDVLQIPAEISGQKTDATTKSAATATTR